MRTIEVSDEVYARLERAALEDGISIQDLIAEFFEKVLPDGSDGFSSLFTPERLAELDRISSEIDAGARTFSPEEVRDYLAERRTEYIRETQS